MKNKLLALSVSIALILSCLIVWGGSAYADDQGLTIINDSANMALADATEYKDIHFEGNVHIRQNDTVGFSGIIEIAGDLYIRGTLNNEAKLSVSGTIYCLHYGSMLSAGDYDYGYLNNKGRIASDGLDVTSSWLGSEPQANPISANSDQMDKPAEPAAPEEPDNPVVPVTPEKPEPPEIPDVPADNGGLFPDVANPASTAYKAIYWAVDNGIVKGYTDGTFQPETTCTREQFSIMLWRFAGEPDANASAVSKFTDAADLAKGARKAVAWAVEQNIVAGFSDGSFQPKADITRAQVAVMLWRFAGKPASSGSSKFSDIGSFSANVQNAIIWLEANKIASGYKDGTFKPDDGCQRQHMAIFLYRYENNVSK